MRNVAEIVPECSLGWMAIKLCEDDGFVRSLVADPILLVLGLVNHVGSLGVK